ncbi:glycosyl transferase [Methylacidiphilum sp. Yel]|uniref:glycosyltransferase n=1 Tax=Methylacidiphilum sp. Yel TaxID=1847730 RepID=UPI00106CE9B6|nr:glycosyltransferase [Methylacidiphilum sp. Yel]TFE70849.1 glycosyl transferase [Methylacidiphilum sp. Yel]
MIFPARSQGIHSFYSIEKPTQPFIYLKNSKFYVRGWFFDAEGKAAKQIKVQSKNDVFFCHPMERTDIQKKYTSADLSVDAMCGFERFCDLSRGIKFVQIFALLSSGLWIELSRHLVVVFKSKDWRKKRIEKKIEVFSAFPKPETPSLSPITQNSQWLKHSLLLFLNNLTTTLKFPVFSSPLLSIVISTRNRAELLYQCFQSILAYVGLPYELIVVDNASTDETPLLLAKTEGIKTFRNDTDLEYLLSVNKATLLAKAPYLLLLNNDIILSPQTVEQMIRTMESYPGCAAVGCKLVRPDGTLQEAGSIVWADGSALAYGRNDPDPMRPEYNFVREVDYCSAACLLVRRELWEKLGGYDPQYAPAYYEDSDLCLSLWAMGYKVLYQPAALVFHYEFGSRPLETVKAMIEKNRWKFLEKWKQQLQLMHRDDGDVLKARDKRHQSVYIPEKEKSSCFKARILVLDDCVPHFMMGRGFPRAITILQLLEQFGYFVTFYPMLSQEYSKKHLELAFMEKIELMIGWGSERLEDFLQERKEYYDFIFVSRIHNFMHVAKLVKKRPDFFSKTRVIYDAEAIVARREILKKSLEGFALKEKEKKELIDKELLIAQYAHRVVAVSKEEAQYFHQKGFDVHILGHSIHCKPTESSFEQRSGFLFVGYMGEEGPNTDGLSWFSHYVLPHLKKKIHSRFEVLAIGQVSKDFVEQLSPLGIKFLGLVEDIQPFFEKCRVFIAPTRYAAGIPMKVHEAASYGLPVVASKLLAKQLAWTPGEELLAADSPEDFAACCEKLYQDASLWKKIRESALNKVKIDCDPKRFEENLLSLFTFPRDQ